MRNFFCIVAAFMRKFLVRLVFVGGFAVLCALALLAWARFVEPAMLTVTEIEVPVRQWAGTQMNIRAVALSDLHLGRGKGEEKRLARIVKKVLSLNPDVVFLLGDYVKGTKKEEMMSPEEIARGLRPLSACVPVLGCLGNHDAFGGNHALMKAFRAQDIHVFRKKVISFGAPRTGAQMQVAVTLDPDSFGAVPDIFPEFEAQEKMPTVVLTHSPDVYPVLSGKSAVDFTLCGHTHGGQICLPGGFALVSSTRRVGTDFAYGLKDVPGSGRMFVSRGLGTSILPMRLFCPPEILVVDFAASKP